MKGKVYKERPSVNEGKKKTKIGNSKYHHGLRTSSMI